MRSFLGKEKEFLMQNSSFRPEKYPIVVQVVDQYLTAYSPDFDYRVAEPWRPLDVGQTEMMIIKIRREIASRLQRESKHPTPTKAKSVFQAQDRDNLTVLEVARLLRVNAMTVRRLCNKSALTYFTTPGGHRRISRASVEKYLREKAGKNELKTATAPTPRLSSDKEPQHLLEY